MRDFANMSEEQKERFRNKMRKHHREGHIGTGVVLLLIGIGALLKSYVTDFPVWIFTWQMLLIVIGLFIGIRHRFHGAAWFVLLLIGGSFLANDYFLNGDLRKHIWPVILIVVGAFFIFRSTQKPGRHWSEKKNGDIDDSCLGMGQETYSKEDFIDTTSIFGGTKKNVLSKDFKGGDVVNVFGGTELNLLQSDITGTAVLELTTIFGGTKLIVPSNWSVRSEAVTIFGGIEDKRQMSQITEQPEKILVLRGTVIFGGIDIKSF
jgi:predicted membrane protein